MSLFTPESRSGWPPSAAQSEYKSCGPLVNMVDLALIVGFGLTVDSVDLWLTPDRYSLRARFGRW